MLNKIICYHPINLDFVKIIQQEKVFANYSWIFTNPILASGNNTIAVFFDIVGAFNSVNIDILCQELLLIGIPKKFTFWLKPFLSCREVFVKYNKHLYGPRLSSKGVSQGGILSPLLFILYIRQLNIVLGSSVKNLQFADDLVVYTSGNNLTHLVHIINKSLEKLCNYFAYLNLDVNPSKSKVIVFGKQNINNRPILYYNRCPLTSVREVRFLGVLFSHNLNWNSYVKHIVNKANKAFNILKSLSGTYWGADPKILLTLYKSLVRSHFEYGFFCFAADKKNVNKLNLIQNKCLRLITGAFRSTPINVLQVECCLPPMEIRFAYLKERFILKLYSIHNNGLLVSLSSIRVYINSNFFYMLQGFHIYLDFLKTLNIYQSNFHLPCYEGCFFSKFPAINIIVNPSL